MNKYICPFQKRLTNLRYLICADLIGKATNLNDEKSALGAFCAHQHFCTCSGRAENTDGARECYQYRLRLKESEAQEKDERAKVR